MPKVKSNKKATITKNANTANKRTNSSPLNKLKVVEIKKELSNRNLPTSGVKKDLLERLQKAIDNEEEEQNSKEPESIKNDEIDESNENLSQDELTKNKVENEQNSLKSQQSTPTKTVKSKRKSPFKSKATNKKNKIDNRPQTNTGSKRAAKPTTPLKNKAKEPDTKDEMVTEINNVDENKEIEDGKTYQTEKPTRKTQQETLKTENNEKDTKNVKGNLKENQELEQNDKQVGKTEKTEKKADKSKKNKHEIQKIQNRKEHNHKDYNIELREDKIKQMNSPINIEKVNVEENVIITSPQSDKNKYDQKKLTVIEPAEIVTIEKDEVDKMIAKTTSKENNNKRLEEFGCEYKTLLIQNLVRPLIQSQVEQLVREYGEVQRIWINKIKTHCYCTYKAKDDAKEAQTVLNGITFPVETGRQISVELISDDHARDLILKEEVAQERGENTYLNKISDHIFEVVTKQFPSNNVESNERSSIEQMQENSLDNIEVVQLDDLFRKTETKPNLYYAYANKIQLNDNTNGIHETIKERRNDIKY